MSGISEREFGAVWNEEEEEVDEEIDVGNSELPSYSENWRLLPPPSEIQIEETSPPENYSMLPTDTTIYHQGSNLLIGPHFTALQPTPQPLLYISTRSSQESSHIPDLTVYCGPNPDYPILATIILGIDHHYITIFKRHLFTGGLNNTTNPAGDNVGTTQAAINQHYPETSILLPQIIQRSNLTTVFTSFTSPSIPTSTSQPLETMKVKLKLSKLYTTSLYTFTHDHRVYEWIQSKNIHIKQLSCEQQRIVSPVANENVATEVPSRGGAMCDLWV